MPKFKLEDFLDIKVSINPSFSPDGSEIAYLNNTTGTFQLYLLNVETRETKALTNLQNRLTFCSYSPTDDVILYGTDVGGNERVQLFLYDVKTGNTDKVSTEDTAMYRFGGWSKDGQMITYASNEKNGVDFDIYVKKIDTKDSLLVFSNGGWCESLGFSPDGSKVVVQQSNSFVDNNLLIIDTTTLISTCITSREKSSYYDNVCWSNNNYGFYLISNEDSDFSRIDYYDIKSSKFSLFATYPWDVEQISLSEDNKKLAAIVNEEGYSVIHIVDTASARSVTVDALKKGISQSVSWSLDNSKIVFSFETPTEARSVWVFDTERGNLERVLPTQQHIDSHQLVSPELVHYKTFDGLSVPAFIYTPLKLEIGEEIPVIISIHGGPEAQYRPFFDSIIQFFVHNGYAVVAPNVRGSSGYGKHYMTLDNKEKRLDSVQDIVSLKNFLETREEFDAGKIVLMGGSYGGYMVVANLAFYPEHWVAGIDIVGITNFVSFLKNTSSWRRAMREAEYGSLKEDVDLLEKISPLNRVGEISTPLFIVHGANDPRVPLSEAEQMYHQLKSLNRDVEMVVYEDEGHGISKLKNRIDVYNKAFKFLEKRVR